MHPTLFHQFHHLFFCLPTPPPSLLHKLTSSLYPQASTFILQLVGGQCWFSHVFCIASLKLLLHCMLLVILATLPSLIPLILLITSHMAIGMTTQCKVLYTSCYSSTPIILLPRWGSYIVLMDSNT